MGNREATLAEIIAILRRTDMQLRLPWPDDEERIYADVVRHQGGRWSEGIEAVLELRAEKIIAAVSREARAEERQHWLSLVAQLAPEEPMNQDEQPGCVWCGYPEKSGYATADPGTHTPECPWVAARRALAGADSPHVHFISRHRATRTACGMTILDGVLNTQARDAVTCPPCIEKEANDA